MDWDAEVDVLCVGAGIGGLATAIAAFDADTDVLVAGALRLDDRRWVRGAAASPESDVATLSDMLESRIDAYGVPRSVVGVELSGAAADAADDADQAEAGRADDATADDDLDATAVYFAAVTAELGSDSAEQASRDQGVPTRAVRELSESELHSRTIETFFGAGLLDWAQGCLGSVTGALYTTVRGWSAETVRDSSDRTLRLAPIGSIEWGADDGPGELFDWLAAAAAERDIATCSESTLHALMFEDRRIIGAELRTPEGPYFVRARHGVVIAPDFSGAGVSAGGEAPLAGTLEVCIVAVPASRFGRVELVAR
ncbi:hypothetical protein [Mycolicibacterium sp. CBMA 234]|uniref:hypothetical protein n=1 Tax=Mycolicibacterium sp. CBMA 234 TaxID=1918495 RepID=UPI0012DE4B72|nr:hypothetical protein [Mycolicibacterium sp. CBMA 234]